MSTQSRTYRLTQKIVAGELLVAPSFVSNGHWMLRKSAVSNLPEYLKRKGIVVVRSCGEKAKRFTDDTCNSVFGPQSRVRMERTTYVMHYLTPDDPRAVMFASSDRKHWVGIAEGYANAFSLQVVWGSRSRTASRPVWDAPKRKDAGLVLMPWNATTLCVGWDEFMGFVYGRVSYPSSASVQEVGNG